MTRFINNTETGAALLSLFAGLGAVGVSSCCVVPLALSAAGIGGAWLGELPGLTSYRIYFLTAAALALAAAWALALWLRHAECTVTSGACARPSRSWRTYSVLCLSTVLVGVAAAWRWIEPAIMAALLRLTEIAA